MAKVVIFGSEGMLGKNLVELISQEHEVIEVNRSGYKSNLSEKSFKFDAENADVDSLRELTQDVDYIFNSIAIIKQRIPKIVPAKVLSSVISVNSNFPTLLEQSLSGKTKIIEIGTDCVFSGNRGSYIESDLKDPTDIYGWSKALGEIESKKIMRIRSSIIGRQALQQSSLLDWFLSQEVNGKVTGFSNHYWNGMTTLQFSKIVLGIINKNLFSPGTYHFYSESKVTKGNLLELFRKYFERTDIEISMEEDNVFIDRSLGTNFPEINSKIWQAAGYSKAPCIEEMLEEFAQATKMEG
jgi:dTDP-4-dehydrorhamnose reductase